MDSKETTRSFLKIPHHPDKGSGLNVWRYNAGMSLIFHASTGRCTFFGDISAQAVKISSLGYMHFTFFAFYVPNVRLKVR